MIVALPLLLGLGVFLVYDAVTGPALHQAVGRRGSWVGRRARMASWLASAGLPTTSPAQFAFVCAASGTLTGLVAALVLGTPTIASVALGFGLYAPVGYFRSRRRARRPSLAERLQPWLGALGPRGSRLLAEPVVSFRGVARAARPVMEDLGARLHRVLGEVGLESRLVNAGWVDGGPARTPSAFRAQQVAWGMGGLVVGLTGGVLLAAARGASPVAAIGGGGVLSVGAILWRERVLDRAVESRRAAVLSELPTSVDLLCPSVRKTWVGGE